jgi:RNA polymerase sigma-70 factor, ECF subfamily
MFSFVESSPSCDDRRRFPDDAEGTGPVLVNGRAAVAPPAAPPGDPPAAPEGGLADAVRRFRDGTDREAAFRTIYEIFFPPLVRFFARRGVGGEEALDLTQETLLGIYKGLDGYEDRQRFAAWVFRIATTTHLKHLRRAATAKRSAVEISRDAMEDPEASAITAADQLDRVIGDELRQALREGIEELPEQMRDCLALRLHHRLAYRDIATIKKLSVETVKAHLARARKRLRERLEPAASAGADAAAPPEARSP